MANAAEDKYRNDLVDYPQSEYTFVAHDMQCKIRRTPMGHWCGYVTLPQGHPDMGADPDSLDTDIHGGLTYGDGTTYGFDCCHLGDYIPAIPEFLRGNGTYWNYEDVKNETTRLAQFFANRRQQLDPNLQNQ